MAEKQEKQFTLKEKLGALGPGFLIVGSFIGPGTVTSSTKAGADYGFQLFWCIIFSVIAVIVMQGMAARLGIVTQMGLAQNLVKDFENRPVLRTLLCGLVAVAITIGGFAYMSGDLTGTAIGISALTGISTRIIAPVWGLCILLLLSFAGDALKYLEKLLGACVIIMAVVFLVTMFVVKPDLGKLLAGCMPSIPKGGLMTCLSLIGTTVVPYNMFLHAASAKRTWHSTDELPLCRFGTNVPMIIGGIVTAGFMRAFGGDISTPLLLVIMAVVSLLAGAAWGMVPATFKAVWNTNETLFTLMMNYVAIQLTSYFVALWENPVGSNTVGVINQRTKDGWFPELFGQEYGLNVVLVLLLTVGMFLYLKYSKQGYEISVVGDSENTARYAGINVKKVTIRTMAISGAICGLAGFIAVAGASHTISTSTAGGRGFTAIIVAWLAQFNTFVMILISFLLVFLQKGAIQIASQFNLNDYASNIITGIILFFILGSEFFINYRIILRGGKEGAK